MKNSNGYGTISKLSGNRRKPYMVRTVAIYINNLKFQFVIDCFPTQKEAKACLDRFNEDTNYRNSILNSKIKSIDNREANSSKTTRYIPKENIEDIKEELSFDIKSSFEEVFNNLKLYKFSSLALKTQKNYETTYNCLIGLKDKVFAELSVNDFHNYFHKNKVSYHMCLKARTLLNQMYELALLQGIVKVNYALYLNFNKEDFEISERERKLFTNSEIELIWRKHNDLPFLKVVLILLYTGIRTSEILNLKNENIDLNERTIRISESKTAAGEKRLIPISNKILPLVESLVSENEYFIYNKNKSQMKNDDFLNKFKTSLNLIGLKHRPHETRHTFITNMSKLNINEALLSKLVGHKSSLVTINTYTHKEISDLVEAIDSLEGDK